MVFLRKSALRYSRNQVIHVVLSLEYAIDHRSSNDSRIRIPLRNVGRMAISVFVNAELWKVNPMNANWSTIFKLHNQLHKPCVIHYGNLHRRHTFPKTLKRSRWVPSEHPFPSPEVTPNSEPHRIKPSPRCFVV